MDYFLAVICAQVHMFLFQVLHNMLFFLSQIAAPRCGWSLTSASHSQAVSDAEAEHIF